MDTFPTSVTTWQRPAAADGSTSNLSFMVMIRKTARDLVRRYRFQFMDCPGQLTKRVEESEISDGCALQGTLRFQALIVMEDQEIHMNCTDPIPFKTEQDISSAITITLNLTVGKE